MKQNQDIENWPMPIFRLTRDLTIIERSKKARILFSLSPVFTGILDEGSRQKAVEFLNPVYVDQQLELTFLAADGDLLLMDVHCSWEDSNTANVIAVPKDRHFQRVSEQLSHLRTRLNETNYDLLLEKERTEKLLQNVRELSAPCIKLDDQRLLIPLFGRIDQQKMETVMPRLLEGVYQHDAQTVIFDLTAMEAIDHNGMEQLNTLVQSLSIMGINITITGVHPTHAKRMHDLHTTLHANFSASLQDALSK